MGKFSVVILCAGSGSRSNLGYNKLLFEYNSKPIFIHTIENFIDNDYIKNIIVVTSKKDFKHFSEKISCYCKTKKNIEIITGGENRFESAKLGLLQTEKNDDKYVLIHDGARPFTSSKLINRICKTTIEKNSCCPYIEQINACATISDNLTIDKYLDRQKIAQIQTPQGFLKEKLTQAYSKASYSATVFDDSYIYKKYVGDVFLTKGCVNNIKLTQSEDFSNLSKLRVGVGYDIHQLVPNRKLILAGVEIENKLGLLGHSDADVILHSLMDALLTASGLRDIGYYFPDTDPQYKNISSLILLKHVMLLITKKGFYINNISISVICQSPKLSPYINEMINNIALATNTNSEMIAISVSTNEKVGIIGKEKAIAATTYVSVKSY